VWGRCVFTAISALQVFECTFEKNFLSLFVDVLLADFSKALVLLYYCIQLLYYCIQLLYYCIQLLYYCIQLLYYCIQLLYCCCSPISPRHAFSEAKVLYIQLV